MSSFRISFEKWMMLNAAKGSDHPDTLKAFAEARNRMPEVFLSILRAIEELHTQSK